MACTFFLLEENYCLEGWDILIFFGLFTGFVIGLMEIAFIGEKITKQSNRIVCKISRHYFLMFFTID